MKNCLERKGNLLSTLTANFKNNVVLERRRRGFNFYDYHFVRTTTFTFFMKKKERSVDTFRESSKGLKLIWMIVGYENKTLRKENYHYYSILYLASKRFYNGKVFRVYSYEEFKPPEHYL